MCCDRKESFPPVRTEPERHRPAKSFRRKGFGLLLVALVLSWPDADVSALEWLPADGSADRPETSKVKRAAFVRTSREASPRQQSGKLSPAWGGSGSHQQSADPAAPANEIGGTGCDGPSCVQQTAAYVQARNHVKPFADSRASEPTLAASPAVVESEPEIIERGPEISGEGAIVFSDEYEAYGPGVPVGAIDGSGPVFGGGPSCEPPCGGCGHCAGCWGPGDVYGATCHPGARPVFDRLWVRGESLLWWIEGFRVPALVTSSTAADPQLGFAGALGDPNTSVLFGGQRVNNQSYAGGRINFGYWLDPCEIVGIEASVFGLEKETTRFQASSDGSTLLARPFFDVQTPAQAAWPVALQNQADGLVFSGQVSVEATTELLGTEVLLRRALTHQPCSRLDLLVGYRFARLDDSLRINQFSTALADNPLVAPDTTLALFDEFGTWNRFHGAEIGVVSQIRRRRWSLESLLKVAFGSTHSFARISGGAMTTPPGGAGSGTTGGLLAQTTNIGEFSQREFTMIPELGLTLGYDLTCRLRLTFGYSLFYWSKVARPGEQIDMDLDLQRSAAVAALPEVPPQPSNGATHPEFRLRTTDLWAQGMSFGLDYRF